MLLIPRYTFGKPVIGRAVVSLSIAGRNGTIVPFGEHRISVSVYVCACTGCSYSYDGRRGKMMVLDIFVQFTLLR